MATKRDRKRATDAKWRAKNRQKARDKALQWKYGITLKERDVLLGAQGNKCAICPATVPHRTRDWAVDHDHTTGQVRGVLCHRCNVGIGMLYDNPAVLRAAANYLEASYG